MTSLPHFSAALGAPRSCICVHGTEWTCVPTEFLGQTCMGMPPPALALPSNASLLHQPAMSPCFLDHHFALLPLIFLSFLFPFLCPDTWVFSLPPSKGLQSSLQSPLPLPASGNSLLFFTAILKPAGLSVALKGLWPLTSVFYPHYPPYIS